MQDPSHPLAQLLRQLSALGNATGVQGQREAAVHLGQPRQSLSAIVLVAVMALAPPPSTSALSAANDNWEG